MFAIVISEKGGGERREIFDKHEINVGRVQGNDLMLPKGNVSKRHARLLFRDGRFIVTDLKSTNGTYVNGRKIAQATIVREGDKIYVGDFVLRVELPPATPSSAPHRAGPPPAPQPSPSMGRPLSAATARGAVAVDAAEYTGREMVGTAPSTEASEGIKHPLEVSEVVTGTAPRIPSPAPVGDEPAIASRSLHSVSTATPSPRSTGSQPGAGHAARIVTSRALALSALIERVAESIDLAPLARGAEPDQVLAARIERLVREKAKALRDDGQLPENVEVDDTIRDAQRELFGLGALDAVLDDYDVTEIRVFGHNHVTAVRAGDIVEIDPPFSSEAALFRAIVRLCRQSSVPLGQGETMVERYLPRGLLVQAVLPPTSLYGHALVIKKRRRAEVSLEDLVRSGTVSRTMATFLQGCSAARANILLVGPVEATAMLLSALAAAGPASDGIVALQNVDELWGMEPAPVAIRLPDAPEEATRLVRAAARLRPERLVVSPLTGPLAAAVASTIVEGSEGVLAAMAAPSLRHALERLVPDLMAARPGLTPDAARSWLLGAFELAVEVARLRDGRYRVMRVAELYGSNGGILGRDIFTFVVERTAAGGAIEGSFGPTGIVPRIADDLAARGGPFDASLFKRERG
ncbi:MAG TPA: ATPase, T2SS/T4P/T4SS family [Polyangiaceae bacterium]|jgi:pilus assembly protein CpaF|nr:ATPase, T2SS/T4P/T4SS family [Polyangiaceae bacterium]